MDDEHVNALNALIAANSVTLTLLIGMLRDNKVITPEQANTLLDLSQKIKSAPSAEARNALLANVIDKLSI